MLGNIYYIFGIIIILSLLKILLKFNSFYKTGEWFSKFEKITGKKPTKSDFRSKEDYNYFERNLITSITEVLWVTIGLFSLSWYIFLSVILMSQLLRIILKPIKYSLTHYLISVFFFITKLLIYCYLVINHFYIHQEHLEFLNYF